MFFFWALILSLIVPLSILISWKIVLSRLLKKSFSSLLLLDVKAVDSFNSRRSKCPHSLSLSCKLTISMLKSPLSSNTLWNTTPKQPAHTIHALSSTSSQRAASGTLQDLLPKLSQVPVLWKYFTPAKTDCYCKSKTVLNFSKIYWKKIDCYLSSLIVIYSVATKPRAMHLRILACLLQQHISPGSSFCISQDRLGDADITNSLQLSVASYTKGCFRITARVSCRWTGGVV